MASTQAKARQLLLTPGGGLIAGTDGGTRFNNLAKGDVPTGDGFGGISSAGTGADGQYLQADSSQLTGLVWSDPNAGFKNRVINGAMRYAQRGLTITSPASAQYLLDRWQWVNTSAAVVTVTRDTDVPSALNVPYSMKVAVTTADASVAAGDVAYVSQPVEGFQFLPLKGQTFVVSFWFKTTTTGTYAVSFLNSARDRSYVTNFLVSVANTWTKYSVRVTHNTTGTWDYVNGVGIRLNICLMAGTTYQGGTGSWAGSGAVASSSQTNMLASTSNTCFLTGVQMELGTIPTPFEQRSQAVELLLCGRYYHKTYDLDTAPGTATTVGEQRYIAAGTGGEASAFVTFPTAMRISPTVTFYSPQTGASGNRRHYNTSTDEAVTFFNTLGERGGSGSNTGHTTGDIYGFQLTLNAEL